MTDLPLPEGLDDHQLATVGLSTSLASVIKAAFLVKQVHPPTVPGLEQGALPVLFAVAQRPTRVSDVATTCHTDVSTTSRHVTTLVRLGLVTKQPDEHDRRVTLVTLTDQGRSTIAAIREQRARLFGEVLHDWTTQDVRDLTSALERLTTSVDTYLSARTSKEA